jgi:hypothetical protein
MNVVWRPLTFSSSSCSPLFAHAARVTRFCLGEYPVMSSYIDKASSHVAVGFKARAVQVFVRTLPKVASFGPCK